eukprot:Amastigsp_a678908_3.p4 type:complete len:116 gc:universal Amastigsp_a678908_3:409-62(-)
MPTRGHPLNAGEKAAHKGVLLVCIEATRSFAGRNQNFRSRQSHNENESVAAVKVQNLTAVAHIDFANRRLECFLPRIVTRNSDCHRGDAVLIQTDFSLKKGGGGHERFQDRGPAL